HVICIFRTLAPGRPPHCSDDSGRRLRQEGRRDLPAEKKDVAKGIAAPGIAETKAIAEEGFIYGLPIVMNYGVMYEYAVDKSSGQFKAPFNQIKNEPDVFTY